MIVQLVRRDGRVILMTCDHVYYHVAQKPSEQSWIEVLGATSTRDNGFLTEGLERVAVYDHGEPLWMRVF